MSQNTKHKFYKKYLELLEKEDKLYEIKNALGYEKLEKPYQYGFNAFNVLREDVSRRKDADIYQYLLDNYSTTTWSKDGVFYKVKKKYISDNRPKFNLISEDEFLKLEPKYKKFFYHDRLHDKKFWNGTVYQYYRCYIEPHYLVMKVVNCYITHKQIIDNQVESDLRFVQDKIYDLRRIINPYYEGFVKKHRRMQTKALRRSDKVNVKKNLSAKKYHGWYVDEIYPLTHKKTNNWW